MKIFKYTPCNHITYLFNILYFLQGSLNYSVYAAEVFCNNPCSSFSDIAYAESIEHFLERSILRILQTFQKSIDRLFLPPVQHQEFIPVKTVEIRWLFNKGEVEHLLDGGISGNHIHSLAAKEVHQPRLNLFRATATVGTEGLSFVRVSFQSRSAVWTSSWKNG